MEYRCWFVELCFVISDDGQWHITLREHGDNRDNVRNRSDWYGEGAISSMELHDIEKVMDSLVSHNVLEEIGVQAVLQF